MILPVQLVSTAEDTVGSVVLFCCIQPWRLFPRKARLAVVVLVKLRHGIPVATATAGGYIPLGLDETRLGLEVPSEIHSVA
jgi:hypothetical protein